MKNKPPIASLAVDVRLHLSWEVQVCVQDYADFCVCIWDYQLKVLKSRVQTDCALKAEQWGGYLL